MNEQQCKSSLANLIRAYPGTMLDRESPALWFEHLADCDARDVSTATAVWIRTERFFPSIAGFLETVEAEAVERVRAERKALGPGPPEPAPVEGELFVDERRRAIAAISADLSLAHHDHSKPGGPNDCAVCGPVIRREPHVHSGDVFDCPHPDCASPVDDVRMYRCSGGCLDMGMVAEWDAKLGQMALRPCATCNRDSYDLWMNGCYMAGHHGCEICRPPKRRRSKADA